MVHVELIYFDGCPSWRTAWSQLRQVVDDLGIEAEVHLRDVAGLSEAERWGFAGSPTLRINGRDLEDYDGPPRMACRRYLDNDGRGWPNEHLLRARLRQAERTPRSDTT